ncbi:acyl-[acyl-carrier-protein] thioesterase [Dietzia maris]|uniref:acyl-[acyl-carrier-protein] thioesterase n=1 Tax=Dietzia maris TaxID=37915 RepID=UPI00232F64B2|nr:acyl-ACP thioesterase domain-containing protein [Dietzia maris]
MDELDRGASLHALGPPPSPEAGFSTRRRVRTGDVDPQRRLRLDSVARYLQDIAADNLDATGHARTDPFWIVRRTVIDVIEPISWPATVGLQRWCSGLSSRWANMRVRLTVEDSEASEDPEGPDGMPAPGTAALGPPTARGGLVETEAFWIHVTAAGLPARISDSGMASLAGTTDIHRLRWAGLTQDCPPERPGEPQDRPHLLRSTDFDPLQHVNNAAYLAVVEDELQQHADLLQRRHRVVIEYLRPVRPGATMTVRRRRAGDRLELWLMVDGVVAAAVLVAPIPAASASPASASPTASVRYRPQE